MRKEFRELKSVERSFEILEQLKIKKDTEKVKLENLNDRVVSDTINSPVNVPNFDRSKMDGYAVKAKNTYKAEENNPIELECVGEIHPGEKTNLKVREKKAVEISTGAMIPKGANAVIKVENTSRKENTVYVRKSVAPGENIMPAGHDIAVDQSVVSKGTVLSSKEIGLISAVGLEEISVYSKPNIGVFSIGDELKKPGHEVGLGEIYDVNTFSIYSEIKKSGGNPKKYGIIKDNYEQIKNILDEASKRCDLIISSGSTSSGTLDMVHKVIEDEGEMILHGISLKPGKPTIFGFFKDTPYIGLPGNPISALVVFKLFVSKIIRDAVGLPEEDKSQKVISEVVSPVRFEEGRTRLLPVGLVESEEGYIAYSLDKGSGAVTSLSEADGYITVEPDTNYVKGKREVKLFSYDIPDIFGVGEGCPIINSFIDKYSLRWLERGSFEGVRKINEGIADFSGVNISVKELDSYDLKDIYLKRGYERKVGLMSKDIESVKIEGCKLVSPPSSWGINSFISDKLDIDIGERQKITFNSYNAIADVVNKNKEYVGIGTEYIANKYGLDFMSGGWENFDFLVSKKRDFKSELQIFFDDVLNNSFDDVDGYRQLEESSEIIKEW